MFIKKVEGKKRGVIMGAWGEVKSLQGRKQKIGDI
jgi:hypothetical protein